MSHPGFLLCFLVPACFCPAAFSQVSVAKAVPSSTLSVVTDRPEAIYDRGETVRFTIQLSQEEPAFAGVKISWMISKDGVPPISKGELQLTNGVATLTATQDEPGFLQCRVTFRLEGKASVTANAGAAIDPLAIKPSLPVPDDFDEFWATQKRKLAAVPARAHLTPVTSPVSNLNCFDLKVDCVGAPVSGYFARPVGAISNTLPIILTVHGAGVDSSQLGAAAGWAKKQFLALDINAHGLPNGLSDTFYTDMYAGELKDYFRKGRESRETIYFLGMFLRLVRALDFLTSQPEWDHRAVIVHGASQGGAQALVAAGLDPRVTFFAAGVPAMCDHTGTAVGRVNGWPKLVPNGTDGKPDLAVMRVARYYDAMNFVTRARAEGIITVGFVDGVCPPTSVYAAYNALPGKKQIFNDPPSSHHVSKAANEAMRQAILAHVLAMKDKK